MKSEVAAWIGLGITVVVYIVTITIFLTKQSDNLKALKETFDIAEKHVTDSVNEYKTSSKNMIKEIKEEFEKHKHSVTKTIDNIKNDIDKQIERNQRHTEDHIKRLEQKQDKHNNLIERTALVEASSKSAHHRIDELVLRGNTNG